MKTMLLCAALLSLAAAANAYELALSAFNGASLNRKIEALERQGNSVTIKSLAVTTLADTVVAEVRPGEFREEAPRERVVSGCNGPADFNSALAAFERQGFAVDGKLFAHGGIGAGIEAVVSLTPGAGEQHLLYANVGRGAASADELYRSAGTLTDDVILRVAGPRPAAKSQSDGLTDAALRTMFLNGTLSW